MLHTLVQKTRFKTVTYTIEDTGLLVRSTSAGGQTSERHIAFEQLRSSYATQVKHNPFLLLLAGLSCMAVFGEVGSQYNSNTLAFAVALVVFFALLYWATRVQLLRFSIPEDAPLDFRTSAILEKNLTPFLQSLFDARSTYLISRWGRLTAHLGYEGQFENLNWLLSNRIISKAQYNEKVGDLDALFDNPVSGLPFDFTPGANGPEWN